MNLRLLFGAGNILVLSLFVIANGGCTSSKPAPVTASQANVGLTDLVDLLNEAANSKQGVPKKEADLAQHDAMHPAACAVISNGSVVYLWGKSIKGNEAGATEIIAYEAKAPKEGGWVLRQNGKLEELQADEFAKQAPPLKKK